MNSETKVPSTVGIHHVTAICGDAQRNVDFYAGVLGLRLVKRTVNFDDPQTYHLYFGNESGAPGSLITFFPWPNAPRGRVGPGQVAVTSFAVSKGALGFWIGRLVSKGIKYSGPTTQRAGNAEERVLAFEDPDGMLLEIVATPAANEGAAWDGGEGIPADSAIRGIHGVTLWEEQGAPTASFLKEVLGLAHVDDEGTIERLSIGAHASGSTVHVRTTGGFPKGHVSVGSVHHIAWRVPDADAQLAMRELLIGAGLDPTPVIDRKYFTSVYFREPGGVLFEIATDGPGFAIDESPEHLGEELMLPEQLELMREFLTTTLPPIHTR
jgi:glyoxalase family protein